MREIGDVREAVVLGPEMELRVLPPLSGAQGPQGGLGRQRGGRALVREGLTIGRAAANDLIIDEGEVGLIHARVVSAWGGGYAVRAVGRSRLVLPDGAAMEEIRLTPGVKFYVGDAMVECREVEGEVKAEILEEEGESGGGGEGESGKPVAMPRLVVCPACYKDMTGVSVVARFCPKCGGRLPPRDAAGYLIPPEESSPLYPVYKALRDELSEKLAAEGESPSEATSLIVLAYANALLNLGWKYEHGKGILRNVEEAARCYEKAGRLSEAWGKGRE
jgi:hypothetical protein